MHKIAHANKETLNADITTQEKHANTIQLPLNL